MLEKGMECLGEIAERLEEKDKKMEVEGTNDGGMEVEETNESGLVKNNKGEEGYNCCLIDDANLFDPQIDPTGDEVTTLKCVDQDGICYYILFKKFEIFCKESENLLKNEKNEKALENFERIKKTFSLIQRILNAPREYKGERFIPASKVGINIGKSISCEEFDSNELIINNLSFNVKDLRNFDNLKYVLDSFKEKRTYYLACKDANEAKLLIKKDGTGRHDYIAVAGLIGPAERKLYDENMSMSDMFDMSGMRYRNTLMNIKELLNKVESCKEIISNSPETIERLESLNVLEEKNFLGRKALYLEFGALYDESNFYGEVAQSITLEYRCVKEMTNEDIETIASLIPQMYIGSPENVEAASKSFDKILKGKNGVYET